MKTYYSVLSLLITIIIMDEESNTFNFNRSNLNSSNPESHTHLMELARLQLRQYDDIDDDDFLMDQEEEKIKPISKIQNYLSVPQHNQTSIFVPIGTMYQAELPQMLPADAYHRRS